MAMRVWEQPVIEDALGEDAAAVLPEAIRLVFLKVRVPRYQHEMLIALARRDGTSVDEIVTRELEDVACAHADDLADYGTLPRTRKPRAVSPKHRRVPAGHGRVWRKYVDVFAETL